MPAEIFSDSISPQAPGADRRVAGGSRPRFDGTPPVTNNRVRQTVPSALRKSEAGLQSIPPARIPFPLSRACPNAFSEPAQFLDRSSRASDACAPLRAIEPQMQEDGMPEEYPQGCRYTRQQWSSLRPRPAQ